MTCFRLSGSGCRAKEAGDRPLPCWHLVLLLSRRHAAHNPPCTFRGFTLTVPFRLQWRRLLTFKATTVKRVLCHFEPAGLTSDFYCLARSAKYVTMSRQSAFIPASMSASGPVQHSTASLINRLPDTACIAAKHGCEKDVNSQYWTTNVHPMPIAQNPCTHKPASAHRLCIHHGTPPPPGAAAGVPPPAPTGAPGAAAPPAAPALPPAAAAFTASAAAAAAPVATAAAAWPTSVTSCAACCAGPNPPTPGELETRRKRYSMVNTHDIVASTSSRLRASYGDRLRRRLPAGLLLLLPSLLSCASLQGAVTPEASTGQPLEQAAEPLLPHDGM